jgi:hemerythrin
MTDTTPTYAPRRVDWTPQLSVGVEDIDEQHRELYRRVNLFLEALADRRGRGELEPLLAYLDSYVREHFGLEQKLMELSGYAGLGEHLAEHHRFGCDLRSLRAEIERDGPTFGVARQVVVLLVDWLKRHLETTDWKFGAHLASFRRGRRADPSA